MTMLATGDLVKLALGPMADGWPGIDSAVNAMQVNVEAALRDQRVRRVTEFVLHRWGAKGGDRKAEAHAIYDFVDSRVDYRRDPAWMELIQDPRVLLARIEGHGWAAGDCDDHAQLAELMGLEVRLPMCSVLVAPSLEPFQWSLEKLVAETKRATEKNLPVPIHVYAAMKEHPSSPEPSRAWLDGDDDAPSYLISMDTARPGAKFGEHVKGMIRYVRPPVL